MVRSARQKAEHGSCFRCVGRFAEHFVAADHHGVGGYKNLVRMQKRAVGLGFFTGDIHGHFIGCDIVGVALVDISDRRAVHLHTKFAQ